MKLQRDRTSHLVTLISSRPAMMFKGVVGIRNEDGREELERTASGDGYCAIATFSDVPTPWRCIPVRHRFRDWKRVLN